MPSSLATQLFNAKTSCQRRNDTTLELRALQKRLDNARVALILAEAHCDHGDYEEAASCIDMVEHNLVRS